MTTIGEVDKGSFRDPTGFVYYDQGRVFRQVNLIGQKDYDLLMSSGLYQALVDNGLLIHHKETKRVPSTGGYIVIEAQKVPFISYPYEWSFSQLKDAALTTLTIQKIALEHGMELKDASAYNIQFVDGKPKLIDTLSFQEYTEGKPWPAYKQFCQHFLTPLALMSKVDLDMGLTTRDYIDGIPLQLANKLLPVKHRLSPRLFVHVGMHARSQQRYANSAKSTSRTIKVRKSSIVGIVSSLHNTIAKLKLKTSNTEWADYYTFTNYNDKSFTAKRKLVRQFVEQAKAKQVIDLGANNGLFSRVAAEICEIVISADIDPMAVEANYITTKNNKEDKIVPIRIDLTNPSPALGWANEERMDLVERTRSVDLVMALALIHHLAISNNLPLEHIARYFATLAPKLILEFVPKEDSQVKILLATREDIFPDYNLEGFKKAFSKYYKIVDEQPVRGTKRTLFLLRSR